MIPVTIQLPEEVALFYTRVACSTGNALEQVIADALFKLAGELSLEALAVDKRFTALFTDEEANNALMRLLGAGHRF